MVERILTSELVIKARDLTKAALDTVAKRFGALDKNLERLGRTARWGSAFQKELEKLNPAAKDFDRIAAAWDKLQRKLEHGSFRGAAWTAETERWKDRTLSQLRAVEAGYVRLGRTRARVPGIVGGAYAARRVVAPAVEKAGEYERERAREYLAGLTPQQEIAAAQRAREVSAKFPSIGQVGVMEHIRLLRGRLGDFGHAMDAVEDVARAQTVLRTLTGGEHAGTDLEQLVLGLESQGLGNDPAKFRRFLNAFLKAKSLFPDLRGGDFREYMTRAKSSKYGLDEDYLANVVPTMIQHEGPSQFGTSQATAFGALVGGRQTKAAKAAMAHYGLLDRNGHIVNESGFVRNPYKWATEQLEPRLKRGGLSLDEEHRDKLIAETTRMFSNRNTAEFFIGQLLNKAVIEKDRPMLASAKGIEAAETIRTKDPFVAAAGVSEQFWNLVQNLASPNASRAAEVLNAMADAIARMAKAAGDHPEIAAPVGVGVGVAGTAAAGGLGYMIARKGWRWLQSRGPGKLAAPEIAEAGGGGLARAFGSLTRAAPWLLPIVASLQPDIMTRTRGGKPWERAFNEMSGRDLRPATFNDRFQFGAGNPASVMSGSIDVKSHVDVSLNSDLFTATVRSVVRQELRMSGSTGSLGKSMSEITAEAGKSGRW